MLTATAVPRLLHPAAWWLWAAGLATASSRTTNPLLLLLVLAVLGYVVAVRREVGVLDVFTLFLRLGLLVVLLRVGAAALLGGGGVGGRTTLVQLPEVPLPGWMAGVRLGGRVRLEAVLFAAWDGLRMATVLACVGAANTLASPRRLLRYVPATLYEVGTAVVVALSYAPQLADTARRVHAARRSRGQGGRRPVQLARLAVPVLADALERSLELAASMESRGYGRAGAGVPGRARRGTALALAGVCGVLGGLYGLLDAGSPALLGLPLLAVGVAACAAALAVGSRLDRRSRYRPDPWALPEWAVTAAGAVVATSVVLAAAAGAPGLVMPAVPAQVPVLPVLPALAVLAGLLPAVASPVPPQRARLAARSRTDVRVAA